MTAREIQIQRIIKTRMNTMLYSYQEKAAEEIEKLDVPDTIKAHLLAVYEQGVLDGAKIIEELQGKDHLRLVYFV